MLLKPCFTQNVLKVSVGSSNTWKFQNNPRKIITTFEDTTIENASSLLQVLLQIPSILLPVTIFLLKIAGIVVYFIFSYRILTTHRYPLVE
jgi:hypothetical protein